MPTTLTSSLVNAVRSGSYQPLVYPGVPTALFASCKLNGGTLTPGAVIQMIPIPTGARILNVAVSSSWPAGTAGVYTVGDGSSTSRFVTTASLTAAGIVQRAQGGIGYRYSVSDDVATPLRWDTIDFNVGAGATQTTTGSVQMAVWYVFSDDTKSSV